MQRDLRSRCEGPVSSIGGIYSFQDSRKMIEIRRKIVLTDISIAETQKNRKFYALSSQIYETLLHTVVEDIGSLIYMLLGNETGFILLILFPPLDSLLPNLPNNLFSFLLS